MRSKKQTTPGIALNDSTPVHAAENGGNANGTEPDEDEESEGDTESEPLPEGETEVQTLFDEAKIAELKKYIHSRKSYPTLAEALAAATLGAQATEGFYGLPFAVRGAIVDENGAAVLDAEGKPTFDESIYAGNQAVLAYLGEKSKAKKQMGIRGIVIYPTPTLDAFLADEKGREQVARTLDKELALVAFRNFRSFKSVSQFIAGVNKTPTNVADFIAQHARTSDVDTETFDSIWPQVRKGLQQKHKDLSRGLPVMGEMLKAIRSKSYAEAMYPKIEKFGWFVRLARVVIQAAQSNAIEKDGVKTPAPLDTSAIEGWLAARDTFRIDPPEAVELSEDVLAGPLDL